MTSTLQHFLGSLFLRLFLLGISSQRESWACSSSRVIVCRRMPAPSIVAVKERSSPCTLCSPAFKIGLCSQWYYLNPIVIEWGPMFLRKSNRGWKKEIIAYLIAILSLQCSPTGYNLGPFIQQLELQSQTQFKPLRIWQLAAHYRHARYLYMSNFSSCQAYCVGWHTTPQVTCLTRIHTQTHTHTHTHTHTRMDTHCHMPFLQSRCSPALFSCLCLTPYPLFPLCASVQERSGVL